MQLYFYDIKTSTGRFPMSRILYIFRLLDFYYRPAANFIFLRRTWLKKNTLLFCESLCTYHSRTYSSDFLVVAYKLIRMYLMFICLAVFSPQMLPQSGPALAEVSGISIFTNQVFITHFVSGLSKASNKAEFSVKLPIICGIQSIDVKYNSSVALKHMQISVTQLQKQDRTIRNS